MFPTLIQIATQSSFFVEIPTVCEAQDSGTTRVIVCGSFRHPQLIPELNLSLEDQGATVLEMINSNSASTADTISQCWMTEGMHTGEPTDPHPTGKISHIIVASILS